MRSNAHKGASYANRVGDQPRSLGHDIDPEHKVEIGVNGVQKKAHRFDIGNESLLVEYDWTGGGNIPSAKLTTVDQAML